MRRIYCLHNPSTTPPSPISDLQAVPATTKDIKQWLEEIFEHTKQTKREFREDIPKLAEDICGLFVQERKPIYSAQSISLTVRRDLLKSAEDLPDDTLIRGEASVIDELFGTKSDTIDWKSAKKKIGQSPNSSETNFRTLKEISRAAYAICNDNRVPTIQGTLFVGQGPKRYRTAISHAKEVAHGVVNCEIMLIEEVGGPLQNVNRDIGVLLITIRMAARMLDGKLSARLLRRSAISRRSIRESYVSICRPASTIYSRRSSFAEVIPLRMSGRPLKVRKIKHRCSK